MEQEAGAGGLVAVREQHCIQASGFPARASAVSSVLCCKCHFTGAVGDSRLRVLRSYRSSSPVMPPEACGNGPGMQ